MDEDEPAKEDGDASLRGSPGLQASGRFDPARVVTFSAEQKKEHKQRLREKFAASKAEAKKRNVVWRVVVPVIVILFVLAGAVFAGRQLHRKLLRAKGLEAKRDAMLAVDSGELIWSEEFGTEAEEGLSKEESLAWALIRSGKSREARNYIENLAVERPESPEVALLRSAVSLTDAPEEARACAIEVLGENPGHRRALDLLGATYQFQRSRALDKSDDVRLRETEVRDYADFLRTHPDSSAVLLRCGFQRMAIYRLDRSRIEELDSAVEELIRAVDLMMKEEAAPARLAKARHYLGRAYRLEGDRLKSAGEPGRAEQHYAMALSEFDKALDLDGTNAQSVGQMILIHREKGGPELALEKAADAYLKIEGESGQVKVLEMIGGLYLEEGDLAAAEGAFQESLSLVPDHPTALLYLVRIKLARGEIDGAVEMLTSLGERTPRFLEAQVMLGEALLRRDERRRAIGVFERVLATPPETALIVDQSPSLNEARNRQYFAAAEALAWLYVDEQENPAAARRAYERALLHGDADNELSAIFGWIQYAEGNYAGALETLSGLIKDGDHSPQSGYYLGATLWKLGRREEAIREIERVLDAGEVFRNREEAGALMVEMWKVRAENVTGGKGDASR